MGQTWPSPPPKPSGARLAAARARVESVLQSVAENVEGEDGQGQGETGNVVYHHASRK